MIAEVGYVQMISCMSLIDCPYEVSKYDNFFTFLNVHQAWMQIRQSLMLEYLVGKYGSNVGDDKDYILGFNSSTSVLYFLPKQIKPIISILVAVFLSSHDRVEEAFIFVCVEVFYCIDCEISNELDSCLRIYIYLLLDVDVNLIKGFYAYELWYIHYYLVN